MGNENPSVHNTEINRIQNDDEGGWEFVCHSCGYRARYTMDRHGTQRLEILFVGDTSARHISGKVEEDSEEWQAEAPLPPDDEGFNPGEYSPEEEWLPENIQAQLAALLRKFD